jgi:hypothetical protein
MEPRGIEPRFAECDSAVIPLDHGPGFFEDLSHGGGFVKRGVTWVLLDSWTNGFR